MAAFRVDRQIVEFVRIHEQARMPTQAYEGDAGWDLYNLGRVTFEKDERREVRTGLAIHIPAGHYGRVTGRSSTIRRLGLHVYEGVADSGFRGEWTLHVWNLGGDRVTLEPGVSIAQLIVSPFTLVEWQEVDKLADSHRGERGYGSSSY